MEKLLWWLIAGTKGGITRAKIIRTLPIRRNFGYDGLRDNFLFDQYSNCK